MFFRASSESLEVPAEAQIARFPAVARACETLFYGSSPGKRERALGIFGALCDDVDHAIDRVGPPNHASGSSNHFDPVNVFEQRVLHFPVRACEEWRVNRAPIDHNQNIPREPRAEAANANSPLAAVDLRDLHSRRQPQRHPESSLRPTGGCRLL